jgi:hypothetical protein
MIDRRTDKPNDRFFFYRKSVYHKSNYEQHVGINGALGAYNATLFIW